MLPAHTLKVSMIFKLLFSSISAVPVVWWLFSLIWGPELGWLGSHGKPSRLWDGPLPFFALQLLPPVCKHLWF